MTTATPSVILMSDPRVAAVPVYECREKLIDLREDGRIVVDPQGRRADPDGWYAHLRHSLVERLATAQYELAKQRLQLLIVEGYRPPEIQRRYWEQHQNKLAAQHPDWTAEQLRHANAQFVAPPEIAPHSTGGAVDLTLADWDGRELDMGCRLNADPEESNNACYTWATNVHPKARERRIILANALTAVGLCNYPTEWWHWSWSERYESLMAGKPHAAYGIIQVIDGKGTPQ